MDPENIQKLLKELREELKNIQAAIAVLERLSMGMGSRRGRPPAWLVEAKNRRRNVSSADSTSVTDGHQANTAAAGEEG